MSSRTNVGGNNHPPGSHYGRDTQPDSISFASSLPLERSKFTQAVIDVFALFFFFLFLGSAGVGVAWSFWVLLFVRI